MEFQTPLIEGVLIKRYKRFLADIQLSNNDIVTAHTPNTGAMLGCSTPGFKTWLKDTENPKRKYPYSWELVQTDSGITVGINTLLANKLVLEGMQRGIISDTHKYTNIRSEVAYKDRSSRIDFQLQSPELPDCFLEVKNVTLVNDNAAYFPDAVSLRGLKHLRVLIDNVKNGNRSIMLYCIQRNDAKTFSPARHIHPEYADSLGEAIDSGVEALAYQCNVSPTNIDITTSVPIAL
jgi:sugar fermentation stimulation protein A